MIQNDRPSLICRLIEVFWILLIVVGIVFKIIALGTSQWLPDSDEAVEGLMALKILKEGIHPIYPFGINYGAGAGWEAHFAALIFWLWEPSGIALKCVGLFHFILTIVLVAAITLKLKNRQTAIRAAALFAMAPQMSQWALKTAGGHQVAVVLALAGWLCLLHHRRWIAVVLLPLAGLAHPIALPFAGVLSLIAIFDDRSWKKNALCAAGLLLSSFVEFVVLRPPGHTIWSPVAYRIYPFIVIQRCFELSLGLFDSNLNSLTIPQGWRLMVALLWMISLVIAVFQRQQSRWLLVALLSPWGIVFLVDVHEFAARHLLIESSITCIAIACGYSIASRFKQSLMGGLILTGALVHIWDFYDPCIYGPGLQGTGLVRANFSMIMKELKQQKIAGVYCLDAMLQWNISFASREQIPARWIMINDRVPEYVWAVDEAFRAGKPVAMIGPVNQKPPIYFAVLTNPSVQYIEKTFKITPSDPK